MNKYKNYHKKKGNKKKGNKKKGNKRKIIQNHNNIQNENNIDNTIINVSFKELPELVVRKIWKYTLQRTFNDIRCKHHKLIQKHTRHERVNPEYDDLHVFAMNYNVLRIMSGMGGLAYEN